MVQYILECIAFQLLFLIIYDFFLKGETFFQWNRVYLIGTYILSLVLPWVKIEAFRKEVPQNFARYSEFWWNLEPSLMKVQSTENPLFQLTWQEWVLITGMLFATLIFLYKIGQLYQLKKQGKQIKYEDFTQIIINNSSVAFSFFKSIFLGDKVMAKKHDTIIAHELVHIKQGHTWDLLFFELMRIIGWFNPLVYVYQNRTAELHEFIADAQVAKAHKSAHYQQLLSQVFQTEHISFINQFFTKSLIKKRIVMLQKSKSKKVWQLKYLVLVPMVLGMLFYTSCEQKNESLTRRLESINKELESKDSLTQKEIDEIIKMTSKIVNEENSTAPTIIDWKVNVESNTEIKNQSLGNLYNKLVIERERVLKSTDESNPLIINLENQIEAVKNALDRNQSPGEVIFEVEEYGDGSEVPFATIEQVPIFPGCENADDQRACFNEKIQRHIGKNFSYPAEAQKAGLEGRVSTMFMITKEGNIENIRMRGPDKLLEDEVERIIKKLPKMTPGKNKGEAVNVPFSIPINFKLQ